MTVLMANARLGVRRRIDEEARNSHGERIRAGWGPVEGEADGVLPDGRTNEQSDGSWRLGVDPACWPIRVGDLVISDDGWSWLVQTADLITNNMDSSVDWVRITAQRRTGTHTVPGGAWFVARYLPAVDPEEPPTDPEEPPTRREPGLWTGYGPPPAYDFGAEPGDEYMDLNTGAVYRMGGGS